MSKSIDKYDVQNDKLDMDYNIAIDCADDRPTKR